MPCIVVRIHNVGRGREGGQFRGEKGATSVVAG